MTEEYYKNQFNALRGRADKEAIKEIDRCGSSFVGVRIITVEEYEKYKELEGHVKLLEHYIENNEEHFKDLIGNCINEDAKRLLIQKVYGLLEVAPKGYVEAKLRQEKRKQKNIVKDIKKELKENIHACDYNTSLSFDSIARKAAFMEILQFIKKCTKKEVDK